MGSGHSYAGLGTSDIASSRVVAGRHRQWERGVPGESRKAIWMTVFRLQEAVREALLWSDDSLAHPRTSFPHYMQACNEYTWIDTMCQLVLHIADMFDGMQ